MREMPDYPRQISGEIKTKKLLNIYADVYAHNRKG